MNQKNLRLTTAAILSVQMIQMGTTVISPIMADLAAAFPGMPTSAVQFLMTFPSLFIIIFSLVGGQMARTFPKKNIILTGCFLFAISGVLAFLMHGSLGLLYLWAAVMGTGVGLAIPVDMSLVPECIPEEKQVAVTGLLSSSASIGAMLMTFFGGILAGIHWSFNYLVYLIAVPAFILIFLAIPGGRHRRRRYAPDARQNEEKGILQLLKIPAVRYTCICALLCTMLYNMIPVNLSMLIAEKQIGTAAQAGTASTVFLFMGIIGGMLYGRLAERIHRYIVPIAFALMLAGQLIMSMAQTMPLVYLGCIISGGTIAMITPQLLMESMKASDGAAAASSLIIGSCNIGGFCTPIITSLSHVLTGSAAVGNRFLVSAICILAVVIGTSIVIRRERDRTVR